MLLRLVLLNFLLPTIGLAQSVTVGAGSFGGSNVYGPMYSTNSFDTAFSRQAYIYPSSVLKGLNHGDSISSIEFYAQADLPMTNKPNLKIYLRMARNDTFPANNINWKTESQLSGTVLVYDANPISIMDGTSGFKNFIFNVAKFKFDTSGGKRNLEILLSYNQTTRQQSGTFWLYENNLTVPDFKSRNEGKLSFGSGKTPDTTRYSDIRKPFIRINFPRYQNNLNLLMTYCLGRVPILAGVKDSIKVLIANHGKSAITKAKIYLSITGANSHKDSLSIGSLKPWEERLFSFANFKPDSSGTDNVLLSLSKDDFDDNNNDTVIREINNNVFSHSDPFKGNAGGIGFAGETGDFVAKFFSDTGVYINQVSVDFSGSGRGFRVGIWDDNATGGFPGSVLFMSDSLTSKAGTYILPVLPRIKVGGGFYVGIRQNTTVNVAFSFQDEDPIRPGAFYFTSPMGNTTWTPFSPGFPYKFNIQPRIQVANDVAPISISYPSANQDIDYSIYDSLGPRATIVNYGFNNQTTPFEVECKITSPFGVDEYKSVKKITLNSGQSKVVFFDTSFQLYNIGNHKITVTSKLKSDRVNDNDSIFHQFNISIKHDLGADIMYTPSENSTFEYKLDTLVPTVRINNFGTIAKNNFKVTFRIKNDTSIIYAESLTKSLAALQQQIISFKAYVPDVIGNYTAECYTTYKDSIPYNDTIRHKITFIKSNDVSPKEIVVPLPTAVYPMGGFFFPKLIVKNYGSKTQDTAFKINLWVYDTKGQQFFQDSLYTPLGGYSETQVNFKRVNLPMAFGKYRIFFKTELKKDQEKLNDTLSGFFTVIPNRDIGVIKILVPAKDTLLAVETLPFKPKVKIKNFGSQTLSNAGPVVLKIYNKFGLIYEDSVSATGNLSYNSSFDLTFKKDFFYTGSDELTCLAYTKLSGDLIKSSDTLKITRFKITRFFDLEVDTGSNFFNGQVFEYENSFFKPQILIKNNGSLAYSGTYSAKLDLYKNGGFYKSITRNFDSISRFATNSFFQDSLINLRQTGNFKLCATSSALLDTRLDNDSACWLFSIEKTRDLALDSFILTDKVNNCYNNILYQPRLKATNLGTKPIVNTTVELKVYQSANIYWISSKLVNLNPAESEWIKFDSTLKFNFTGAASARAIAGLFNDSERANDTSYNLFNVALVSAIKSIEKPTFSIYPNPSSGKLFVLLPGDAETQLTIWNTSGQKMYEKTFELATNKIELNLKQELGLIGGIYFLRIKTLDTNKTQLYKLVVY